MPPAPGWYPDPAMQAPLRYWDGRTWTTATAAVPAADQSFAPQSLAQPPAGAQSTLPAAAAGSPYSRTPVWATRKRRDWRSKNVVGVVTAVAIVAVVAVVGVPKVLGESSHASASGSAPTSATLANALLTPAEVGATAGATYTVQPADNSGDNGSGTQCKAADKASSDIQAHTRADTTRDYASAAQASMVEEELTSVSGDAAAQFANIGRAISSCHQLNFNGVSATLTTLPAPQVAGSDDTFAFDLTTVISGHDFDVSFFMARFADTFVQLTYASTSPPSGNDEIATELLQQASSKFDARV